MTSTEETRKHVLDGYRVLDLTQVVAGPTVTRLMAEMGAEIVKVELAPGGDHSRGLPFFKDGRSAYFVQQNRGKKSLCLDPTKERGREVLRDLAERVDVLVENFSPGVIDRFGLGWETLRAINPRLVMCSISAFGQTGPLSRQPGYDYVAQAYAGVMDMIGEPDGPPVFPMLALGDVGTGVHALAAIVSALLHRERSGRGQYLDISILDSYFHCHEINVEMYTASGGAIEPRRSGTQHWAVAPLGVFRGKSRYLFVLGALHHWAPFCRAIGRPDLIDDPRFADNPSRMTNLRWLVEAIEAWLASMPSDEESIRVLQEAHVPVAPILSVAEAVRHPHLRFRRTIRAVPDRVFGEVEIPGMPLRFSEFPEELALEAPFLGEHNEEILTSYLALAPAEVEQLHRDGVLSRGNT
jgi:crotonobetainyl-CoA:carnitine CoA-transferase CaiB-like acyl-CoA transferase